MLVHREVHDGLAACIDREMDEWILGNLFDEATDLGPLVDESQAE